MGIRESQQVWELIDRRCWWSQLWVGKSRRGRDAGLKCRDSCYDLESESYAIICKAARKSEI